MLQLLSADFGFLVLVWLGVDRSQFFFLGNAKLGSLRYLGHFTEFSTSSPAFTLCFHIWVLFWG